MLGLTVLITAIVTEKNVNAAAIQDHKDEEILKEQPGLYVPDSGTSAGAVWLIILGVVVMLYELLVIFLRFINVKIINSNISTVIIVVSV